MKKVVPILIVSIVFPSVHARSFDLVEKEEIKQTLQFSNPGGNKYLVVDNVFGSISVTGYSGDDVQLIVHKKIRARSKEKMEKAKEKIYLDISEEDNQIVLYVDGPFRCNNRKSIRWRGWKREGFEVIFDFDLKVPRETALELNTVNDGEISVSNIQGDYDINNVNGGIEMDDIAGSGRAYALNGDLSLVFRENPENDCYYGSLNGEVKLYFQSPLSADFNLKTFNGEVYSDFPVDYLPVKPATIVERDGMNRYKTKGKMHVRAGNGGPEIELDGFNGDMFILKKK